MGLKKRTLCDLRFRRERRKNTPAFEIDTKKFQPQQNHGTDVVRLLPAKCHTYLSELA